MALVQFFKIPRIYPSCIVVIWAEWLPVLPKRRFHIQMLNSFSLCNPYRDYLTGNCVLVNPPSENYRFHLAHRGPKLHFSACFSPIATRRTRPVQKLVLVF